MALGADRFSILRNFLLRGVTLAAIGLLLGGVAGWLMRPVLNHLLSDAGVDVVSSSTAHGYGIVMNGAVAAMMAAAAILLAALAASWLPARRAAAVEPMQALRSE
jgi:ABC-type lipoprotein release transport system permease subunit